MVTLKIVTFIIVVLAVIKAVEILGWCALTAFDKFRAWRYNRRFERVTTVEPVTLETEYGTFQGIQTSTSIRERETKGGKRIPKRLKDEIDALVKAAELGGGV